MPRSLLLAKDWDYVLAIGDLKTGGYFRTALNGDGETLSLN